MSGVALPGRDELVRLLAEHGSRSTAEIVERIDSLEVAWLVHAIYERYGIALEPTDLLLGRMSTVTGATAVLREALMAAKSR